MNKVIRNGKVAVIYSPGFGAGWSTWNTDYPQCQFEPELVDAIEKGASQAVIEEIVSRLYGDDFYVHYNLKLKIEWIPIGTRYRIEEYDGNESIEYADQQQWGITNSLPLGAEAHRL